MADITCMLTMVKRLLISLLAACIATVVAFQILYSLFFSGVAGSHDGQAGMSAFFGAVFFAPVLGILAFALLFRLSRKWR